MCSSDLTADEAAAVKTAAKAVASAEATAATATVAAGQVLAIVAIGAGKVFADANIAASLTASNGTIDAVHTYVVASIGVNLVASTVATCLALLRENGAISALTDAQKTAINAAHAATLANLAADLSGRNANEALDDPIAIAAAQKAAADGVKAAWQNVSNLQARAASTFTGTGPNGGGFAMTFAGFTAGVGDVFQIGWAGVVGAGQGHAAWADGVIPFVNPFEDWLYDGSDPTLQWSQFFGGVSRDALLFAVSIVPWGQAAAGSGTVVTHWGPAGMTALRNGDWVMVGAPNLVRYVFSGVIQPGRHFQWPWNFIVRNVPPSTLSHPPGREAIKYILCQRIYLP